MEIGFLVIQECGRTNFPSGVLRFSPGHYYHDSVHVIFWLKFKHIFAEYVFLFQMPPPQKKQECIPVGCILSAVTGEGVCLPGGEMVLPRGRCTPPVDRMTDTCENITFPQLLLRTVIKFRPDFILPKLVWLWHLLNFNVSIVWQYKILQRSTELLQR